MNILMVIRTEEIMMGLCHLCNWEELDCKFKIVSSPRVLEFGIFLYCTARSNTSLLFA